MADTNIEDQQFLNWYENKDFTVLEGMLPKFHREYYCRTAWFQRDEEIKTLQSKLDLVTKVLKDSLVPLPKQPHHYKLWYGGRMFLVWEEKHNDCGVIQCPNGTVTDFSGFDSVVNTIHQYIFNG